MIIDSMSIKLQFKGKLLTDPVGTSRIFHDECLKGFHASLKTLRHYIRARCPIGASIRLRNSITYRVEEVTPRGPFGFPTGRLQLKGEVYARSETEYALGIFPTPWSAICPYARAVERGTRPHWPPTQQIRIWAGRVLPAGMTSDELDFAAFFIARAISKRGTRARFMFRDGFRQYGTEKVFEKNMQKSIATAILKSSAETPWWAEF